MPERADSIADTLIVMVGAALVAVGAYGLHQQLAVIWVDGPAPEWWGMARWVLGVGFLICLISLALGLRGLGGFTALPATAGSCLGTLVAVVLAAKLLIRDYRLGQGIACEVTVASVDYTPQRDARKPYLVAARVEKMLRGDVALERLVFRVQHQDQLLPGVGLRLEYRKPWRWMDLRTWFRRQVRHALEEAVSVSVR